MYEYQLEMVKTNSVIFYIYYGVEEYIKRNVEALNPEFNKLFKFLIQSQNMLIEHKIY
jgi:transcriptional regulator of NAD metabolism